MTPDKAVSRGVLVVNGSVKLVMFGAPAVAYGIARLMGVDSSSAYGVAFLAFVACWPLAWLTWSLLVPRWRLWAYNRVDNIDELKSQGVAAGLIWREGHLFERTEIRTPDQRRRLRELEQAWAARRS